MSTTQINQDSEKIAWLQSEHVTYTFYGNGCPLVVDTYNLFGFKTKCIGCNIDDEVIRQNEKAIERIDSVYGIGWFNSNEYRFYLKITD
ncbi:MAG: hypothetical protein ACI9JN_002402 [Bacteroidia bacterium]|jgi:hypothetical protein